MKAAGSIRPGMIRVDRFDADDITVPSGGFGQSGFGRDRSLRTVGKSANPETVRMNFARLNRERKPARHA